MPTWTGGSRRVLACWLVPVRRGAVPEVGDRLWGDRPGEGTRTPWRMGRWAMSLTDHGIEDLRLGARVLAPRIFFSVRDESWATPRLPVSYRLPTASGVGSDASSVAFSGAVDGFPLAVAGTIATRDRSLVVTFTLTATGDAAVARAGPCVLHDVVGPQGLIAAKLDNHRTLVALKDEVVPEPIVSGYRHLELPIGDATLAISFEGATFEMEDQRNWGDATFKSYCPPLEVPRPLRLRAGARVNYTLTFDVDAQRSPARVPSRIPSAASQIDLAGLSHVSVPCLPRVGLTHPGGALGDAALEKLRALRARFLHLFVDLGDAHWAELFAEDLSVAAALDVPAVVTLECPPRQRTSLASFSELAAGTVDTAFVFEPGSAVTSDAAADAAREHFTGTGIAVGAGTRGHFASLNRAGRVPDSAQVVGVALAAAAHDDDRRALTTSPASYAAIVKGARQLAGPRPLYLGPVGLAPTFDSWSAPGHGAPARQGFDGGHRRHPTRFGAAWAVAAYAALAALGVERLCLAGTVGGRGVGVEAEGHFITFPIFDALVALARLTPGPYQALAPGGQVAGLIGTDGALLAVMHDTTVELCRSGGAEQNMVRSATHLFGDAQGDGRRVISPDIVALSWREDAT